MNVISKLPSREIVLMESSLLDYPVKGVTVFSDRAEVTRLITLNPSVMGELCVKINNLSILVDPDSVCLKGSPHCNILEIAHDVVISNLDSTLNTGTDELPKKLLTLTDNLHKVSQDISVVNGQKELIEKYAQNCMTTTDKVPLKIDDVVGIMNFHGETLKNLNEKANLLTLKSRELSKEIAAVEFELSKSASNSNPVCQKCRMLAISIEVLSLASPLEMQLSYMVSSASWSPSYDIRISSRENQMQLTYYGEIVQSSGEDWVDCEVTLSTATPSVGGAPPQLPRRTVQWLQPKYDNFHRRVSKARKSKPSFASSSAHREEERGGGYGAAYDDDNDAGELLGGFGGAAPPGSGFATATVSEAQSIGSSTFTIPRLATVESDSKAHKCVIAGLQLTPLIMHFLSPSLVPAAYLQTMTKNSSQYPLLPSASVKVFLDGNFVTTTSMAQANPGETFTNFLGVDTGVKVQFLPVNKRHDTKGWLSKADSITYRHSTIIHNTKSQPCHMIIADALPLSTDEKIKVELVHPNPDTVLDEAEVAGNTPIANEQDMISVVGRAFFQEDESVAGSTASGSRSKGPKEFVTQSKQSSNLIWSKGLAAGEKLELRFTYRVSYPQGTQVELC